MHCLDEYESFRIFTLGPSDRFFIESAANIYAQELGSYNPVHSLIQALRKKQAFLLCAVDTHQAMLGTVIGWPLSTPEKIAKLNLRPGAFGLPAGLIKSIAVTKSSRGSGTGRALVRNILHCFRLYGCSHAVCEAWEKAALFWGKEGFELICTVPEYWYAESSNYPDFCIKCGSPCTCDAMIMGKPLHSDHFK